VGEVPGVTALIGAAIIFTAIVFHNFMPEGKNKVKRKYTDD
jgi:hypothetical protein